MMTSRSPSAPAQSSSDGFIVVAALWILTALATLASVYAVYVANTAIAAAVGDDVIQADALVSASLEITAYQLTAARAEERPTRGQFAFRMGRVKVAADFCSEAARIDLNMASKELLAGLFAALGAHPDDAAQYADRIIGWRTAPSSGSQDKEESLYRAAGLDYGPRGGPFAHGNELALVLGLPPGMVERAMRYVTVYSGRAEINVLDAAPEVIAALPGMSPERLNAVLGGRASMTAGSTSTLLGPAQGNVTTEGSKATRVTVRLDFDNGRRIVSEAVILVGRGDEPFRVLSWQDDIDTQPSGVQAVAQVARGGRR